MRVLTAKSKVVVQSTLQTLRPNRFLPVAQQRSPSLRRGWCLALRRRWALPGFLPMGTCRMCSTCLSRWRTSSSATRLMRCESPCSHESTTFLGGDGHFCGRVARLATSQGPPHFSPRPRRLLTTPCSLARADLSQSLAYQQLRDETDEVRVHVMPPRRILTTFPLSYSWEAPYVPTLLSTGVPMGNLT